MPSNYGNFHPELKITVHFRPLTLWLNIVNVGHKTQFRQCDKVATNQVKHNFGFISKNCNLTTLLASTQHKGQTHMSHQHTWVPGIIGKICYIKWEPLKI